MDLAAIIALVAKGLSIIELAVKVGAAVPDVLDLINKVKGWVSGTSIPTTADDDEMDALETKYLAMLTDTTNDDKEGA